MIPVNTTLLKERLVAAATEPDGTLTHEEEVMQLIELMISLTSEEDVDEVIIWLTSRPFDARAGRAALANYHPPSVSVTCVNTYVVEEGPTFSSEWHAVMQRLSAAVLDHYDEGVGLEFGYASKLAAAFGLFGELGPEKVGELSDLLDQQE